MYRRMGRRTGYKIRYAAEAFLQGMVSGESLQERSKILRDTNGSYRVANPPEAGYLSLANEIIAIAFSDLRLALRADGPAARERQRECMEFLCSDWAAGLTGVDLPLMGTKVIEEYQAAADKR